MKDKNEIKTIYTTLNLIETKMKLKTKIQKNKK